MSAPAVALEPSPAQHPPEWQSARGVLLPERFALFAGVAVLCCLSAGALHGRAAEGLAIAAIAIAMWHGAYDHVQARQILPLPLGRISPRLAGHWLPVFLGGYVGLAALTLLGWRLFPLASLLLFLGYSAWHFGTEPEQATPSFATAVPAVAFGALPIVAACRWHGLAVAPIFARMLDGTADAPARAQALTGALSAACWPVLALALLGAASGVLGRSLAQRAELLGLAVLEVALFVCCDPLVAFAVFFCCWHTPEHLVTTSIPRSGNTLQAGIFRNLRAGLLPWLLSLLFLAGALLLGRHQAASYEGEVFIVLSALTVPHMALNELRRIANGERRSLDDKGTP